MQQERNGWLLRNSHGDTLNDYRPSCVHKETLKADLQLLKVRSSAKTLSAIQPSVSMTLYLKSNRVSPQWASKVSTLRMEPQPGPTLFKHREAHNINELVDLDSLVKELSCYPQLGAVTPDNSSKHGVVHAARFGNPTSYFLRRLMSNANDTICLRQLSDYTPRAMLRVGHHSSLRVDSYSEPDLLKQNRL